MGSIGIQDAVVRSEPDKRAKGFAIENAFMNKNYPNWISYWNDVSERLSDFIDSKRSPDAEGYILRCLGFFSYVTEDVENKITDKKDLARHAFPLIIELQDILRALLATQKYLLLASSAFNLRAAFEIRCNFKYIFAHQDPAALLERLSHFYRYEQIVGSRLSPNLQYEGEEVERAFANLHPYWAKKDGLLKDNAEWNGENKKLKDICIHLKIEDEFFHMFKQTSKFIHGSPIVKNLYRSGRTLVCIPDPSYPTMFSVLATHNIMECLMEYCEFFGIEFSEVEYRIIQLEMLKVEKVLKSKDRKI